MAVQNLGQMGNGKEREKTRSTETGARTAGFCAALTSSGGWREKQREEVRQALIPWELKSAVRPGCILFRKCSSHTHSSRRRIIIVRLKLRSCEYGWVTKITKKLFCSGLGHTQVYTHGCSEAVLLCAGTGRGCHSSLSAFQRLHGRKGLGRRGSPGRGAGSTDGYFWRCLCVVTIRNPFI